MPKAKLTEQQQKNRSFLSVVSKHLTLDGIRKEDFAKLMGMSRSTLWSKLNDPLQFRQGELLQQYRLLQFSDDEKHILL